MKTQWLSLIFLILAGFSVEGNPFIRDEDRCTWRGLPSTRGQWVGGQNVQVDFHFRRLARDASGMHLFLSRPFLRPIHLWHRELHLQGAVISAQADSEGYWTATFQLPANLPSHDDYYLILRSRGLLGWFTQRQIAVSPKFWVQSLRDAEKQAERVRLVHQKQMEEAERKRQQDLLATRTSQPMSFLSVNGTETASNQTATVEPSSAIGDNNRNETAPMINSTTPASAPQSMSLLKKIEPVFKLWW